MTAVEVAADSTPAVPGAPGTPAQADRAGRFAGRLVRPAADLVLLVRPQQWSKNLLAVPLALLDAPAWSTTMLARTGWAVLLFTLASCLVYIVNDIADERLDRGHPVKRSRPVASGRVPVAAAAALAALLGGLLVLAVALGPPMPWWPLAGYLALNLAYSRWLKHVPLLDVCLIAAGFVLRVGQGYAATGASVSVWLLTTVFTVCLVLVLGKRRSELAVEGAAHRPALRGYTLNLADHLITLSATLAIASFLLYLRSDAPVGVHRNAVLLAAVPLTLFGIFRYLQAVLVSRGGADPARTLLRDRLIVATAALLAAVVGAGLLAAHPPLS